jgi:hypothetical protein
LVFGLTGTPIVSPCQLLAAEYKRQFGARVRFCRAAASPARSVVAARMYASAMRLRLYVALIIAGACTAFAADTKPPAKMEEPMAGKMKRPGMKQGEVKKAAEKKQRAMKPKLEKEEKEMTPARK